MTRRALCVPSREGRCRMAEHLKFERFCWFDRQLLNNRYPTASHFARHFALSTKTVQRTKRGKFF